MTAQTALRDTVKLEKTTSSPETKHKKGEFSKLVLTAMIMAIESEYDVICADDDEGHIIALRNNKHFKVNVVTGEETPAPDYDKEKCPYCSRQADADIRYRFKSDSDSDSDSVPDSDYDYFILRWK